MPGTSCVPVLQLAAGMQKGREWQVPTCGDLRVAIHPKSKGSTFFPKLESLLSHLFRFSEVWFLPRKYRQWQATPQPLSDKLEVQLLPAASLGDFLKPVFQFGCPRFFGQMRTITLNIKCESLLSESWSVPGSEQHADWLASVVAVCSELGGLCEFGAGPLWAAGNLTAGSCPLRAPESRSTWLHPFLLGIEVCLLYGSNPLVSPHFEVKVY